MLGARDDQVQVAVGPQADDRGVEDIFAVLVADPGRADGSVEGHAGDRQGRRGADHGRNLGVDRRVQGLHRRDDLDLVGEALREQGPDRAVDQAGGEDLVLARAALAAEEAARDAASGVGLLLVVHGQRQEVALRAGLLADHHGDQHHGVVHVDEHGAVGLAGDLAGLQGDGLVAELEVFAYGGGNHGYDLGCGPRALALSVGLGCASPRRLGPATGGTAGGLAGRAGASSLCPRRPHGSPEDRRGGGRAVRPAGRTRALATQAQAGDQRRGSAPRPCP